MPKISVIIPVFNAAPFLPDCLESILRQTFADFEVVCIDDGSTDNSADIIREYSKKDQNQNRRIKLFQKTNAGISHTRAYGIFLAEGEYLTYVDADDWLEPNALAELYVALSEHKADIAFCSYNRVYEHSSYPRTFDEYSEINHFDAEQTRNLIARRIMGLVGGELSKPDYLDAWSPVWGKLYKKSVVENMTFADLKQIGSNEDGLFNMEAFYRASSCVFVNKCFYNYRKFNTSMTNKYRPQLFEQWFTLYGLIENLIEKYDMPPEFVTALSHRISLNLLGAGINITNSDKKFRDKHRELSSILHDARIKDHLKALPLGYFPLHWKALFFFVKHKWAFCMLLMLVVIKRKLNSRK